LDIVEILFIALGLAMDAFAVSVANGITTKHMKISDAFKMAIFFGSFQAFMPVLGWLAGFNLRNLISGVDHWIAFGLLGLIGCKMIYESFRLKRGNEETASLSLYVLLMLSLATSIDALAVGLSFAFLKIPIATPIIVIGTVTFLLSFVGVAFGSKFGHLLGRKVEIAGAVILICIGTKILIEHLI
jgi:putative Mn2+ efflux pump MntP